MELILTSNMASVAPNVAKVIANQGKKLAFIDTPAEPEKDSDDIEWLYNDRASLVEVGFEVTDYSITGKTEEEVRTFLDPFDIIYVSGGDTFYFLKEAANCNFYKFIDENIRTGLKTYIGTSTGSMVVTKEPYDYFLDKAGQEELKQYKGFDLIDLQIVPHWGSADFDKDELLPDLFDKYDVGGDPLIFISDEQFVHYRNNSFSIF